MAEMNWVYWRNDKASEEMSEEQSREMWSEKPRGYIFFLLPLPPSEGLALCRAAPWPPLGCCSTSPLLPCDLSPTQPSPNPYFPF